MLGVAIDLNDLRIFRTVAALGGFSAAAATLGLPKSSVSRAISRLERNLAIRLFQRTTRDVSLTAAGQALHERCDALLAGLDEALAFTASLADTPRGKLSISAGIGFGINVLGRHLPGFLERYPEVSVAVDLTSRNAELVSEQVDVAIRMGSLPESGLIATRLGTLTQYLCASRAYLDRNGRPESPADLVTHHLIGMPGPRGQARPWRLVRSGEPARVVPTLRIEVNDALTICALIGQGAGIGVLSAYLCGPAILAGKLERVLPEWSLPPLPVSLVFPSRREMSPVVRAFVDYMRAMNEPATDWLCDPLVEHAGTGKL
jgi:LysR family transcriptional regulator, regulator for bpeEF and oprC